MSLARLLPNEGRRLELSLVLEEAELATIAFRLFHAGADAALHLLHHNKILEPRPLDEQMELTDALSQYVIAALDTYLRRQKKAREAMPETPAVDHRPPA